MNTKLLLSAIVGAATLAGMSSSHAQILTYTGGSSIWGQASAWGGTAYAEDMDIVIGASGFANPSMLLSGASGTNRTVKSLTYNSNADLGNQTTLSTTGSGTLNIGAGGITIESGGGTQTISSAVTVNLASSQTWSNSGVGSLVLQSKISGASTSSLQTQGQVLLYNSANDFSGNLTVSSGLLRLFGGSLPHGNITVNSGATLDGNAFAFGTVKFTIDGALGQTTLVNTGGTYGLSNLDLVVSFDAAPTLASYTLIDATGGGSITGAAFKSVNLPAGWSVQYNANSVVLIPEPSTFALLATGLVSLLAVRRRR